MDRRQEYSIPEEARKDIAWWGKCSQEFNGVSLMWLHQMPGADSVIATDACPVGYGGTYKNLYFRGRFPKKWQSQNIALLEILAVMVALKLWGEQLRGQYFWIKVDNEAVATVLNTGSCQDKGLQNVLRETALLVARFQFVIKARHIAGVDNRVPDWLSRWHEKTARKQFREMAKDSSLKHVRISSGLLELDNK